MNLNKIVTYVVSLGLTLAPVDGAACEVPVDPRPKVLVDSYHAHNFLHLGLREGEYSYHRYTALRRAAQLLRNRGCIVEELLVGPIESDDLRDVDLFVVNLVSMDRPPFLVSEIQAIVQYVRRGGGILCVTDHSNCYYHQFRLLPLWTELGLIPTFETVCERQPNCRLSPNGNAWTLIRRWAEHPISNGVSAIAMQTSGRVKGDGQIAFTSADAWADNGVLPLYGEGIAPGLYGDLKQTVDEEQGSQAVILARDVAKGRVVVIADQNSIGDAVIGFADNWRMWLNSAQWCGRLELTQPVPSPQSGLEISLHCYDPFAIDEESVNDRPFDFASQDDNQFYHLWVWLNRYCWASCGPDVSRPDEVSRGRSVLVGVADRLPSEGFQSEIQRCLGANGVVLLLAQEASLKEFSSRVSGSQIGGIPKLTAISTSLQTRDFEVSRPTASVSSGDSGTSKDVEPTISIRKVGSSETASSAGEIWICLGAGMLSNREFAAPSTPPNARQQHIESWLHTVLSEIAKSDSDKQ